MKTQLLNAPHLHVFIFMQQGKLKKKMLPYYRAVKYNGDNLLSAVVILLFWDCLTAHKFAIRRERIL